MESWAGPGNEAMLKIPSQELPVNPYLLGNLLPYLCEGEEGEVTE